MPELDSKTRKSLIHIGVHVKLILPLLSALHKCRVPDDCIDSRRYPLFMAREVMRGLIEQLKDRHTRNDEGPILQGRLNGLFRRIY